MNSRNSFDGTVKFFSSSQIFIVAVENKIKKNDSCIRQDGFGILTIPIFNGHSRLQQLVERKLGGWVILIVYNQDLPWVRPAADAVVSRPQTSFGTSRRCQQPA